MPITEKNDGAFVQDDEIIGKTPKVEPKPEKQIGIDTNDSFFKNLIDAGTSNKLDMSALDPFLTTARSRDQLYSLIDDMGEDPIIAAALESYAEDATNTNDNGDIVWADSSDTDVSKYVNYLLKSMKVNKNVYGWVHSLCKYGDIYLRLYRESDYNSDNLFDEISKENGKKRINEEVHLSDHDLDPDLSKEQINESVKIKAYSKEDHYVHYIELVPNPAEMFELTKFGKSYAYIKSETNSPLVGSKNWFQGSEFMRYKFNRNDIKVYSATEFVHGYLEDNQDRVPEEVSIEFNNSGSDDDSSTSTYKVRRGQSMLYTVFKIWRMLQLLENSILLNRVTKSAIVRIFGIEVGDMPKEDIAGHLIGVKSLIEQKSSLEANKHMNEYTNPGPIENNVYIPKHNGVGAIDMQTVGGDVNVGELTDLDYFRRKMFAALRIPGQYLNFTDDNAGFSGGQSLAIISARYAKMVIRIQNTIIQALTDVVNLMLIDKGLTGYVNKFTINMRKPVTQDDIDRKDALSGNLQSTADIMNLLSDLIESPEKKLNIVKELLSPYLSNPEVIDIIQKEIDRLDKEEKEKKSEDETPVQSTESVAIQQNADDTDGENISLANDLGIASNEEQTEGEENSENEQPAQGEAEQESEEEDMTREENALPSPSELGLDFTDSNLPDFEQ